MRQSIRGYTDAVIEQVSGSGDLTTTAAELGAVRDLVEGSQDLRRTLIDTGVPVPSRRGLLHDLLQSRVAPATLRLVSYCVEADRAPEVTADLAWLAMRVDAAAHQLEVVGETVLGHKAAEERLDGYATATLEVLDRGQVLHEVEDELFRFMRIVDGSEELTAVLTDRDVSRAERGKLVTDLLRDRATPATLSLAGYATQVGRPRDYPALLGHLVDRVAAESDRRVAEVRAAVELDDAQQAHLEAALSRVAGRTVEVRVTVDPAVLGGFVATIGDTVVDGSVRHRLDILKERLALPEAHTSTGDSADG